MERSAALAKTPGPDAVETQAQFALMLRVGLGAVFETPRKWRTTRSKRPEAAVQ